ncbi:V-set domain-containing T-cell activation inhibitor 1 [Pleurodeles waltl]|uniref:V-set domain-containing T-cell activation inhibitor 1 n=1 Tax=Pleurodeles waltl TaxID=8319 RepID=UPI003709B333
MATAGQIIFRSMIAIIIILVAIIALIIGFGVSGNSSNIVKASTSVSRIGDVGILDCTFTPDIKQNNVILWEKVNESGIVYRYEKGEDKLTDQNAIFKGRTELFPTQVGTGNASLKLTDVTLKDAGTYKCTVTTSAGTANAKMEFRVGMYSPVDVTSPTNRSLMCSSDAWYPEPTVRWLNKTSGANLTQDYKPEKGLGIAFLVNLELAITIEAEYTCVVENALAKGSVDAKLKASGQLLKESSLQVLSASPHLLHQTPLQGPLLTMAAFLLTLL